jgi:hypothetical protein
LLTGGLRRWEFASSLVLRLVEGYGLWEFGWLSYHLGMLRGLVKGGPAERSMAEE